MTDVSAPAAEPAVTSKKQFLARLRALGRRVLYGTATGILSVLEKVAESYLKFFEGIKSWTAASILASFVALGGAGMWGVTVPKRNAEIAKLQDLRDAANERADKLSDANQELSAQLETARDAIQQASVKSEDPPPVRKTARRPVLKKQPESKGFWENLTTGSLP